MSLFSILFHFLSILLGEWLQKLAHNTSQWQPFLHKVRNYHLSREGNHIFFYFFIFLYKDLRKHGEKKKKGLLSNSGLTLLLERRGGESGYTSNFHGIPTTLIIF